MRKLLLMGLVTALAVWVIRRSTGPALLRLMESMMERGMPRMMDACFAQMSAQRRQFMLTHCRAMLDRMDEKYVKTQVA